MGLLTPVAVKIGSISWMPRLLPQIVRVDDALRAVTGERFGLLDIAGLPNVSVVVAGRRSGVVRSTRLLAVPVADGWRIAGSYFGAPEMPQWVHNLRATTSAEVIDAGRRVTVSVEELDGNSYDDAWQELRAVWPNFELYRMRTDRRIPVFALHIRGER